MPYGLTGRSGVASVWGAASGTPKTSLEEAWYTRVSG